MTLRNKENISTTSVSDNKKRPDNKTSDHKKTETKKEQFLNYYKQYEADLDRMAMAYTKNKDDAQDLIQNTLLRAFKAFDSNKLGDLDQDNHFKFWLLKIMHNTWISMCKKQHHNIVTPLSDFLDNIALHIETAPVLPTEDKMVQQDIANIVDRALKLLPKKYRDFIIMSDFLNMDNKTIAKILNITPEAVRGHLHRSKLLLKNKIKYLESSKDNKTKPDSKNS